MENKTYKDIIIKTSNMNPYKEEGNRESYSSYNEGWSDACDVILAEIEEMGQVESKRPNIQDYKKRATGWYKDNGDDYDNDLQNYIDLLEEKLSQHPTEQPTNELSDEEYRTMLFERSQLFMPYGVKDKEGKFRDVVDVQTVIEIFNEQHTSHKPNK